MLGHRRELGQGLSEVLHIYLVAAVLCLQSLS